MPSAEGRANDEFVFVVNKAAASISHSSSATTFTTVPGRPKAPRLPHLRPIPTDFAHEESKTSNLNRYCPPHSAPPVITNSRATATPLPPELLELLPQHLRENSSHDVKCTSFKNSREQILKKRLQDSYQENATNFPNLNRLDVGAPSRNNDEDEVPPERPPLPISYCPGDYCNLNDDPTVSCRTSSSTNHSYDYLSDLVTSNAVAVLASGSSPINTLARCTAQSRNNPQASGSSSNSSSRSSTTSSKSSNGSTLRYNSMNSSSTIKAQPPPSPKFNRSPVTSTAPSSTTNVKQDVSYTAVMASDGEKAQMLKTTDQSPALPFLSSFRSAKSGSPVTSRKFPVSVPSTTPNNIHPAILQKTNNSNTHNSNSLYKNESNLNEKSKGHIQKSSANQTRSQVTCHDVHNISSNSPLGNSHKSNCNNIIYNEELSLVSPTNYQQPEKRCFENKFIDHLNLQNNSNKCGVLYKNNIRENEVSVNKIIPNQEQNNLNNLSKSNNNYKPKLVNSVSSPSSSTVFTSSIQPQFCNINNGGSLSTPTSPLVNRRLDLERSRKNHSPTRHLTKPIPPTSPLAVRALKSTPHSSFLLSEANHVKSTDFPDSKNTKKAWNVIGVPLESQKMNFNSCNKSLVMEEDSIYDNICSPQEPVSSHQMKIANSSSQIHVSPPPPNRCSRSPTPTFSGQLRANPFPRSQTPPAQFTAPQHQCSPPCCSSNHVTPIQWPPSIYGSAPQLYDGTNGPCFPAIVYGSPPYSVVVYDGRSHSCERLVPSPQNSPIMGRRSVDPYYRGGSASPSPGARHSPSPDPGGTLGRPPRPRRPNFRKAKTVEVGYLPQNFHPSHGNQQSQFILAPQQFHQYKPVIISSPTVPTPATAPLSPQLPTKIEVAEEAQEIKPKVTYKTSFYKCMRNLLMKQ